MTDNEIIKALEEMAGFKSLNLGCKNVLHHTIHLINRQKAEIERLKDLIISNDEKRLSSSAIMMKKEQELMHAERISGLEAEIKRLQTTKKTNKKQITELKQHILRLQHILISFMNEVENWEHKYDIDTSKIPQIAVLGTEKGNIIKQIKSEARKEFAERLKEVGTKVEGRKGFEGVYVMVNNFQIDNLLKEMEGEE